MPVHRFAAGEVLFSEGDASDRAYLLQSGRVEISKSTGGGSVRLAVLGAGELVGEMGLLEERPRSATARALEEVTAESIQPEELVGRLVDDPGASFDLLRALFERLRATNQMFSVQLGRPASPSSRPVARILPCSPATRGALPDDGLELTAFPYRVGRTPNDRTTELLSFNELEIEDREPYTLSPNHFALDLAGGGVVVRDRGSRLGTLVNGVAIGAAGNTDVAVLQPGYNEVVAGPRRGLRKDVEPPFRFRIVVS
jgi:CRP/FNR family transcriptional regulator, cyclic AMP receptor protein